MSHLPQETTPLLPSADSVQEPDHPSPNGDNEIGSAITIRNLEYHVVLLFLSCYSLLPFFVSGSFLPAIPSISEDLETSDSILSLLSSASSIAAGVGSHFGAAYLLNGCGPSSIHLTGVFFLTIGSFGMAFSRTIPQLTLWRFVQTFGAGPGLSVSPNTKHVEERHRTRVSLVTSLLGPTVAPAFGGLISHYISWQSNQIILGIWGAAICTCIVLFPAMSGEERIRETNRTEPSKVDGLQGELRSLEELVDSKKLAMDDSDSLAREELLPSEQESLASPSQSTIETVFPMSVAVIEQGKGRCFEFLDTVRLLMRPDVLVVIIAEALVLFAGQALMTPLSVTVGARYEDTNGALGVCFLSSGLGHCISASIETYIFRCIQHRIVARRPNSQVGSSDLESRPEDRLITAVFASTTLVPLTVLGVGLATVYVQGTIGVMFNAMFLFVNSVGVTLVLGPSAKYLVEVMHEKDEMGTTAVSTLRTYLTSLGVTIIMPMIDNLGLLRTNLFFALLVWIASGYVVVNVCSSGAPLAIEGGAVEVLGRTGKG
ncbi:major facilitator superfamily domain-containing protein [Lentinula raphanica]|uniref:Major facilitator superfamily domain-containing protein n=1 Tax=Lentinula raphanica TaxID=153919 RepID=A0AA38PEK2_9AGAR|nr:major facilitator superfamily domain-containing protein [Lentinula raphanica]